MAISDRGRRILIVDDDEGLLVLMGAALEEDGFDVATVATGTAALSWLSKDSPDLMILDLKMSDFHGVNLVEHLRADKSLIPFIVVTGQGDERVAVEVMKQGALDYVMKESGLIEFLPTVVRRALDRVRERNALAVAEAETHRLEEQMTEIAEAERNRIGSDLHDGLGQQLTAVELYCFGLRDRARRIDPQFAETLDLMGKMLREAIVQTRSLSHGLVPVGDEPDALRAGLSTLAARTTATKKLHCRFESSGPVPSLDRGIAGHLYRIAQEAVNNALKHSGAKGVWIRLSTTPNAVVLEIEDDGRGLSGGKSHGMGLGVMRHRAKMIHAEFTLLSRKPRGVILTCSLPYAH